MYFWRIERLKARLAVAPFTDRAILPYAAANGALIGLAVAFSPEKRNGWDTVAGLVTVPVIILGILWVYRQNGGHTGTDFLQRYTAIGWVAFLRLVPVALLAGVMLFVIKGAPSESTLQSTGLDVVLGIGLAVAYYQRVGVHVGQVARGLPNTPLQPTSAAKIE